jgi:hypothetical protein
VPEEKLAQPPVQEERLLQKELAQWLEEAIPKLAPREQKLVELARRGLKAKKNCAGVGH